MIIATLSTALLVVQHFDAPQQLATLVGTNELSWSRGQTISSFDQTTPLAIQFGDSRFWLDERTEVKLIDGRDGSLIIDVLQGRIVATGPLTISTREIKSVIEGPTSFVHYSWLNKIEVAIIGGEAYEQSTLPPYEKKSFTFDPMGSIANEFYTQVFTKIQTAETNAE